jgi:Flp pilus assembly protein TadG
MKRIFRIRLGAKACRDDGRMRVGPPGPHGFYSGVHEGRPELLPVPANSASFSTAWRVGPDTITGLPTLALMRPTRIPMAEPALRRSAKAGTVALEFAMISPAFLGLLLFLFELGFLLYAQTALDYAVNQAARQLQTSQETIVNGATQAAFQSAVLCPYLSAFLACSGVVVSLQPVATFQTASTAPPLATSTVNPGVTGSLMLLRAYYTPGIPTWPLNVTTLVGTAAYLNE